MNTVKMPDAKTEPQPKHWSEKLDHIKEEGGRKWKSLKERVDAALDRLDAAFKKRVPIETDRSPDRHL